MTVEDIMTAHCSVVMAWTIKRKASRSFKRYRNVPSTPGYRAPERLSEFRNPSLGELRAELRGEGAGLNPGVPVEEG